MMVALTLTLKLFDTPGYRLPEYYNSIVEHVPPNGLAAIGLIGGVLYFLLTEHRAHTRVHSPPQAQRRCASDPITV